MQQTLERRPPILDVLPAEAPREVLPVESPRRGPRWLGLIPNLMVGAVVLCLPITQIAALGYFSEATRNAAARRRFFGSRPSWFTLQGSWPFALLGAGLFVAGIALIAINAPFGLEHAVHPQRAGQGAVLAFAGSLFLWWNWWKEGLRNLLGAFLLFLPGSAMIAMNWDAGFVFSFERLDYYLSRGPLLTLAGCALVMAAAIYTPMAWAHACTKRELSGFFELRTVWRLVRRRPLEYAFWVGLGLTLSALLQPARLVSMTSLVESLAWGSVFFAALLLLKLGWGRCYAAAAAQPIQAAWWRRWLAGFAMFAFALLYAFKNLAAQFLGWRSEPGGGWEWFYHFIYLLPSPVWSFWNA